MASQLQFRFISLFIFASILLLIFVVCVNSESRDEYMSRRKLVTDKERRIHTGGKLKLSEKERKVNSFLMSVKEKEISSSMENGDGKYFPPAIHFFRAKPLIEKSTTFKIIKKMPKGAALHIHDFALVDVHWVVANLTYRPDCYMCFDTDGVLLFHYFAKPDLACDWVQVEKARLQSGNPELFDHYLRGNLTMVVANPEQVYTSQSAIWMRFLNIYRSIGGLLTHSPVFTQYMSQALQDFYDDNVQLLEMRSLLLPTYDLNGKIRNQTWVLEEYIRLAAAFHKTHPNTLPARIIYNVPRLSNNSEVLTAIKTAIRYQHDYPDTFLGFDLVSHEDDGRSLLDFRDELLYPSQRGANLTYFFHAGETNWIGESVDINILDALLLNTSRIGHGFAITKHPEAMRIARQRDVPLEVNPISNQVLGLVGDLRNHPAAGLMSEGFPVVISCDDPSILGSKGLSYDFYEAFMGLGGGWADLATLKQLAMDSIKMDSLLGWVDKTSQC